MQHQGRGGAMEWTLVGAGFVFLLLLTVYTARQARSKLLEAGVGNV